MRPVLSICIPTYQRSRLLAPLLRELDAPGYLPFSFEVVVADNASADAGYEEIARYQPANYTLRYYRNQQNIGAIPNLFGVLRRAQGESLGSCSAHLRRYWVDKARWPLGKAAPTLFGLSKKSGRAITRPCAAMPCQSI